MANYWINTESKKWWYTVNNCLNSFIFTIILRTLLEMVICCRRDSGICLRRDSGICRMRDSEVCRMHCYKSSSVVLHSFHRQCSTQTQEGKGRDEFRTCAFHCQWCPEIRLLPPSQSTRSPTPPHLWMFLLSAIFKKNLCLCSSVKNAKQEGLGAKSDRTGEGRQAYMYTMPFSLSPPLPADRCGEMIFGCVSADEHCPKTSDSTAPGNLESLVQSHSFSKTEVPPHFQDLKALTRETHRLARRPAQPRHTYSANIVWPLFQHVSYSCDPCTITWY